ncbi:DMT family transporter [Actinomyces sp. B33]|uniref:DMT family transporter n=1 Tax=Actinomyces sp. B33 TaxID=2942131 RepID=UPI0023401440|nr:DMT family transporter [Actinomyces sp. B33]MDC4232641.1 DMT family transporter [Actinomyces sp. B33]
MRWGILSGALWGLDTVVLGIALGLAPFLGAGEASLASALLHDAACALILLIYMGARGRLGDTLAALRTRSGKAVMLAALLGGPFGMSGYLIAINHIGPGYTAIISTFYPAVGTLLAFLLLKERMRPRQIIALLIALTAIVVIGYSSTSDGGGNPVIGVIAALACVVGWGSEAVILAWGMRDEAVDNETALQIRETTSALVYLAVVAPLAGVLGFTFTAVPSFGTGVIALAALAGTASYLFYYTAINTVGASRGMALNISYSAWAVIFAFVLMGTTPTPLQIVCCLVILVFTVLAATPDWKDLRVRR